MLREVGIEAELVLVRTGMRGGFDPATASLAPFDHAIAYVPSLDLYIDGTAEATGTAELPEMDRSSLGLRVTGGEGKLVTLPEPDAAASWQRRSVDVTVDKDGAMRFHAKLETRGVDAPAWRRRYQADASRRERVATDLAGSLGPVELLAGGAGLSIGDLDAIEKPVTLDVSGQASAKREGNAWAIPSGPSWSLVAKLASRPTRSYPVLLGARREHSETWTITLPRGMTVAALPKATALREPFGRYSLEVSQEANKVRITTTLALDAARIEPSSYDAFRRFCQAVDASAGAPLLLTP
jgi:hypothetical protein